MDVELSGNRELRRLPPDPGVPCPVGPVPPAGADTLCNIVLEACIVAANAIRHTIFQPLLPDLFNLQSVGGCTIFMHRETNCVQCAFAGAKPQIHVVCVCGVYVAQNVAHGSGCQ